MVRSPSSYSDESEASSDGQAQFKTRSTRGETPRRQSVSSAKHTQSTRSGGAPSNLPLHVAVNEEANSFPDSVKGLKLFKKLAGMEDRDFQAVVDQFGTELLSKKRDGKVLPIVRCESVVEGVTTEQVLGTIMSSAARREWDPRFQASGVVSMDNSADQGVLVEVWKGIFPALPAHHFIIARNVVRSSPGTLNGPITLISRSTRADVPPPRNSSKGTMDVVGWNLTADGPDVRITAISQLDLPEEIAPYLYRILVAEMATCARELAAFVEREGFAPFFIRWGAGSARLIGDGEGDMKAGKAIFRVDGKGTEAEGQRCWLTWDDKMFRDAVEIRLEPRGIAEVTKVAGHKNTVEFVWSSELDAAGARITVVGADGEEGDVYVDGQQLGAGASSSRRKSVVQKAPARREEAVAAVAAVATVAAVAAVAKRAPSIRKAAPAPVVQDEEEEEEEEEQKPAPVVRERAPVKASRNAPILAPVLAAEPTPAAASASVAVATRSGPPADAVIILSKDLYFTSPQVKILAVAVVGAYLWGKFRG